MIIIIIAASIPGISHEVINATAIRITWNITGDVNGFIIQIDVIGVNEQLTDNTTREFVVNGLSPETDYTISVRGYYELLGPAGITTVRLAGIAVYDYFLLYSIY